MGNWLRQFTHATLVPLVQLNHDLVVEAVQRLALPRLTIDVDGTVVRTGATAGSAFRGFNPHHRKDTSYYPLLAHVAQTVHILRVKNRPANVHDSKQSVAFLREVITGLRTAFGRRLPLEFRMDAAFCQRGVFRPLAARVCAYAIKVGHWSSSPLKQLAAEREHWLPVAPSVTGFFHDLHIPQWDLHLRVMIYRKHVAHESPKNFQLDLFTPDDGHYEYSAVATNLRWTCPPCTPSSAAAGPRRRPSRSSRGNSPSTSSQCTTTAPTAPGSISVSSRTTSSAASSWIPSPCPNPPPANAPIRTRSGACVRSGSCS